MPPNSQNQNDPYGFILNSDKPPRQPLNIGGGPSSTLFRVLLVGAGLVFLIIIIVLGLTLLNRSNNAQNQKLLELAQTQTEILRIAEATGDKTSSANLNQIIANTSLTTQSSLNGTVALLAKRGQKADEKKLSAGQNPANDEILTKAEQNSNFDEAYSALLNQQIGDYLIQLNGLYESSNQAERATLEEAFTSASLIKEQLKKL